MVYTDQWKGCSRLARNNRGHATVNHTPGQREWVQDYGDGIYEVHDNTHEGLWAALRTYLRPFGVSASTTSISTSPSSSGGYNLKEATLDTLIIIFQII
ncbi:hypothetical protein VT84_08835 [Gemmata sp. SH-PL17]|nr:hypothetical protein VT84_08835 [Gemmata sp. SH-PL17]